MAMSAIWLKGYKSSLKVKEKYLRVEEQLIFVGKAAWCLLS
jgi:hypothetical protein